MNSLERTKNAALDTDGVNGTNACPGIESLYNFFFNYMFWDREKLVLVLLLTSAISLWFIKTFLEDIIYTKTFNYEQTEQQAQQLHNVNEQLRDTLLEDESYTTISKEAAKEGFVKGATLYITQ